MDFLARLEYLEFRQSVLEGSSYVVLLEETRSQFEVRQPEIAVRAEI
jgi:hypothetical protein